MARTRERAMRKALIEREDTPMSARVYGIGLYAPAGFVVEPDAIARAVARLEAAGHRVVVDPTVTTRWQRFSAPDDERIGAIVAANKRWLGHSDFTGFQLAALAATGMVSFAGPMAAYDFGAPQPSAF